LGAKGGIEWQLQNHLAGGMAIALQSNTLKTEGGVSWRGKNVHHNTPQKKGVKKLVQRRVCVNFPLKRYESVLKKFDSASVVEKKMAPAENAVGGEGKKKAKGKKAGRIL